MASLAERIDTALSETRTLVIGAQVLAGMSFRAAFEKRFELLSPLPRHVYALGVALLLLTIALLMAPAAYHRIVEGGQNSGRFHLFVTRASAAALFPFGLGLGIQAGLAAYVLFGAVAGWTSGAAAAGVAFFLWYGWESAARGRGEGPRRKLPRTDRRQATPLPARIKHVLTETRVVLPGAQALLGFQFLATLTEAFEQLPGAAKIVHLASFLCVGLATLLLMTPAAYHRIVEQGEETERFHRLASALVTGAMVPIALGMAGDFSVILVRVTHSMRIAALGGSVALALFVGLWFGFTAWRRAHPVPERSGVPAANAG
jgi:hypothetical protein